MTERRIKTLTPAETTDARARMGLDAAGLAASREPVPTRDEWGPLPAPCPECGAACLRDYWQGSESDVWPNQTSGHTDACTACAWEGEPQS